MWWQKRFSAVVLFLLSLGVGLFAIYPVVKGGLGGVFYTIDPDVVYVANAIQFANIGQIQYIDHPGTPAIVFISALLLPIRLYLKFVNHESLTMWTFLNYEKVFFYIRIIYAFLLATSVFIFSYSIYNKTKSFLSSVIGLLLVLLLTATLYAGSSISAETISIFLISLWLLIYTQSGKLSSFLAGFAVANKLTNLPLSVAAFLYKPSFKSLALLFIGFGIGIWPIRNKMGVWFTTNKNMLMHNGIHGQGSQGLLDLHVYWASFNQIVGSEIVLKILILAFVIIGLLIVSKKISFNKSQIIIAITSICGIFVFAKYPLGHYQITNVFLGVFSVVVFLSQVKTYFKVFAIILLTFGVYAVASNYFIQMSGQILGTQVLEVSASDTSPNDRVVWEWARSRSFSLLWSKSWAMGLFSKEIQQANPSLISFYDLDLNNLDNYCWTKMYVQQSSLQMVPSYQKYHIETVAGGTKMVLLLNNKLLGCKDAHLN